MGGERTSTGAQIAATGWGSVHRRCGSHSQLEWHNDAGWHVGHLAGCIYVTGEDWSPIVAKIPQEAIPFLLMGLTWLFDYLRKITENSPHVIIQKDESGVPQVVAIEKAAG